MFVLAYALHQAEELNRFPEENAGKHYGYPFCWTEYSLPSPPGLGRGTVWAWPSFLNAGTVTDETCRTDYIPPELALRAHTAPLGITFYQWKDQWPSECAGIVPFPKEMDGYAFVANHGSWNRADPIGYDVVSIAMDANGRVASEPVALLRHEPPNAKWDDGLRPVDVDFDPCGRLVVSSDGSRIGNTDQYRGSNLLRIEYTVPVSPPTNDPTMAPKPTARPSAAAIPPTGTPSKPPATYTPSANTPVPSVPTKIPMTAGPVTQTPSTYPPVTRAPQTQGPTTIGPVSSTPSIVSTTTTTVQQTNAPFAPFSTSAPSMGKASSSPDVTNTIANTTIASKGRLSATGGLVALLGSYSWLWLQ